MRRYSEDSPWALPGFVLNFDKTRVPDYVRSTLPWSAGLIIMSQPLKDLPEKNGVLRNPRRFAAVTFFLVGPFHWLLYCLVSHHRLALHDGDLLSGPILGGVVFAVFMVLLGIKDLGWRFGRQILLIAILAVVGVDLYLLGETRLWGGLALTSSLACVVAYFSGGFAEPRRPSMTVRAHSFQRGILLVALVGVVIRDGYWIPLGGAGEMLQLGMRLMRLTCGRLRIRLPVAAWIALRTAGVATAMVGSPTPPSLDIVSEGKRVWGPMCWAASWSSDMSLP